MIFAFDHGGMIYAVPTLDDRDREVIEGIEQFRSQLRHFIGRPRRWQGLLRRNLRARAMRGSNSIEGYDVSLDDALAILEDDEEALTADQRTVLEVTGYRNAMTYVQQLADDPDFSLDQSLLRGLHFMMLGHDLDKSPGSYRRGAIYVRDDDTEEIVYEGPDPDLVPSLMRELVGQLQALLDDPDCPIFVAAAMGHLNLIMIHPFRDGNGRMARCLQTLMLSRYQVLGQEFASIEEWLGRNTVDYYDILAKTGHGKWNPANDATAWIRFNLTAHHMQAQTVWHRVQEADELWTKLEALASERGFPERAVQALYTGALGLRVRRIAYEEATGLEYATAGRDLRNLATAGLLQAKGETRGRFYRGSPELREIYGEVRAAHRGQIVDPYDAPHSDGEADEPLF